MKHLNRLVLIVLILPSLSMAQTYSRDESNKKFAKGMVGANVAAASGIAIHTQKKKLYMKVKEMEQKTERVLFDQSGKNVILRVRDLEALKTQVDPNEILHITLRKEEITKSYHPSNRYMDQTYPPHVTENVLQFKGTQEEAMSYLKSLSQSKNVLLASTPSASVSATVTIDRIVSVGSKDIFKKVLRKSTVGLITGTALLGLASSGYAVTQGLGGIHSLAASRFNGGRLVSIKETTNSIASQSQSSKANDE